MRHAAAYCAAVWTDAQTPRSCRGCNARISRRGPAVRRRVRAADAVSLRRGSIFGHVSRCDCRPRPCGSRCLNGRSSKRYCATDALPNRIRTNICAARDDGWSVSHETLRGMVSSAADDSAVNAALRHNNLRIALIQSVGKAWFPHPEAPVCLDRRRHLKALFLIIGAERAPAADVPCADHREAHPKAPRCRELRPSGGVWTFRQRRPSFSVPSKPKRSLVSARAWHSTETPSGRRRSAGNPSQPAP